MKTELPMLLLAAIPGRDAPCVNIDVSLDCSPDQFEKLYLKPALAVLSDRILHEFFNRGT